MALADGLALAIGAEGVLGGRALQGLTQQPAGVERHVARHADAVAQLAQAAGAARGT